MLQRLAALEKARDQLAALARLLAAGDYPTVLARCLDMLQRLQRLEALEKARDQLAALARLLAAGDYPPSAIEVNSLIDRLAKEGK
jgi:hypothetical protein